MCFGIAQDLVHNTAAFDLCKDMFHEDTDTSNQRILGFLCSTEFMVAGLFFRLIGLDVFRFKSLEARIFKEDTARRKRIISSSQMRLSWTRPAQV